MEVYMDLLLVMFSRAWFIKSTLRFWPVNARSF